MTKQEIFDKVATHLLTQNAKSMNASGCAYRGAEGRKCAIGCLIPDEDYTPRLEGKTVMTATSKINVATAVNKSIRAKTLITLKFLQRLQAVHDLWPVEEWRNKLAEVAKDFELDAGVLL